MAPVRARRERDMCEFIILTLFVKVAYHQNVDCHEVREFVTDAYLLVAPKRLSKLVR